jgi:hypothetical protein
MSSLRLSLPVSARAWRGFGRIRGLLILENAKLRLEYQKSDNVLGILKSSVRVQAIALQHLREANFGAGWFWLRPYLHFDALENGLELEGKTPGTICFDVPVAHKRSMRQFADALRHARAVAAHDAIHDEVFGAPPKQATWQQEHAAHTQTKAEPSVSDAAKQLLQSVQKLVQNARL